MMIVAREATVLEMFGVRIYQDRHAPKFKPGPDGVEVPVLATLLNFTDPPCVLVHPDRWDEFRLWINAPDVADHPELRAWFRDQDAKWSNAELAQPPAFAGTLDQLEELVLGGISEEIPPPPEAAAAGVDRNR